MDTREWDGQGTRDMWVLPGWQSFLREVDDGVRVGTTGVQIIWSYVLVHCISTFQYTENIPVKEMMSLTDLLQHS